MQLNLKTLIVLNKLNNLFTLELIEATEGDKPLSVDLKVAIKLPTPKTHATKTHATIVFNINPTNYKIASISDLEGIANELITINQVAELFGINNTTIKENYVLYIKSILPNNHTIPPISTTSQLGKGAIFYCIQSCMKNQNY